MRQERTTQIFICNNLDVATRSASLRNATSCSDEDDKVVLRWFRCIEGIGRKDTPSRAHGSTPAQKVSRPRRIAHRPSALPQELTTHHTMVLRIRLSRFGKKHAPFYNIVLTHARTARNSRPLEVLGTYNPVPQPPRPGDTHGRPWKDIKLDVSRARYWVGVGAQPSDTAWRLLSMVSQSLVTMGSSARSVTGGTELDKKRRQSVTFFLHWLTDVNWCLDLETANLLLGRHSRTTVSNLEDSGPGRQGRLSCEVVNTRDARYASRRG